LWLGMLLVTQHTPDDFGMEQARGWFHQVHYLEKGPIDHRVVVGGLMET
jgi:hypothetical protein